MPFMIGCTADEYAHRYHADDPTFTEQFYQARLLGIFGAENAALVAAEYPSSEYGSPAQAFSAMFTDRNLTCSSRRIASIASSRQTEPVWRYHFRHTISTEDRIGDGPYHTSDLHFVFQHMTGEHFDVSAADVTVESHFLKAWTNFARTGNPNDQNETEWPVYSAVDDPYFILQEVPAAATQLRADKCAFWNSLN
jgi:carboxylesterase type B